MTAEYKINYVRPVSGASALIAEASVAASGKMQAVCRCDLFMVKDGNRQLRAAVQGTIRNVAGSNLPDTGGFCPDLRICAGANHQP